ncbi:MAG: magnesium transporter [Candidatus Melainabacteria bacterium]|nr:magnesium transporter [Candidatus Melainabacteria bacterium]
MVETKPNYKPLVKGYFEKDPLGVAQILETMSEEEATEIIKSLPSSLSAKAIKYMPAGYAALLLKELSNEKFCKIALELDPLNLSTIFLELPNDKKEEFLNTLPEKNKKQIQEYLTFPEDSVGRIMSTNYLAFYTYEKVKDVIYKLRQLAKKQQTESYAYVLNEEDCLVGVINMHDLLLASSDTVLENIAKKDIFAINCFSDRETAANEISKRKYFVAPVTDSQNKLMGIIKAEQLIHEVQEEASEDIQRMFGAGGDEKTFSPISFSLQKRLPWLHVNLLTAFIAAAVVAIFEDIIAKMTILAVFLPVVAGQGGNAGAQSLAVVMRGLVMREIPRKKVIRLVAKEALLGIISGLIIGIVTGVIAYLWHGNSFLGIVIGLAMLVNLFVAGLSGAAIPLTMKAIGLDPAQCSNIILTTITDVMGFFSFLGFAVLFQNYLI